MSVEHVFLTGASAGIGLATARHLAGRGLRVYGTSRRAPARAAADTGLDTVEWLQMDVGDESQVRKAVAAWQEREAGPGGLVCNAGYGIFGSVEEVGEADALAQLDTNFLGVLRCLRAALPAMRERGGRVVLTGSLGGRAPIPFQAHYSASKAAVEALAFALRNEVRPFGIQVSLVEPGDIHTGFNERMNWSPAEGSAYGEAIARVERTVRENLPKAPGPTIVARAIERALFDRRPRLRYAVGAERYLVPFGRRVLPDGLFARLLGKYFGI